jgi:uncharacterized membrane protein YebE (DUF533 family)
MNPFDILGAVMQAGMSPSSGNRMGGVLGQMMGGGAPAGAPMGAPGGAPGAPGGGLFDIFAKMAGGALGGQGGAPGAGMPGAGGGMAGGFPAEILKQVAGAMFGGSSGQGNAGAGLGSMAIFGTLAAQALDMAKGMMSGGQAAPAGVPHPRLDDESALIAGMRAPNNPTERQQAMDMATLTLKAMMTAMKADGQLDEREKGLLLGKLQEGGITPEEQRFVDQEMQKPIDLDALVRDVPNQQAAAQLYAASLMAIEVDTDAERRYLSDFASKLKLDPNVVAYLHKAVGLA